MDLVHAAGREAARFAPRDTTVLGSPDWSSHYGLGAFEPAETVPDLSTTGVSVAVIDRVALGDTATLDSHIHARR